MPEICPECGCEDLLGMEYSELYDGILLWVCRDCAHEDGTVAAVNLGMLLDDLRDILEDTP